MLDLLAVEQVVARLGIDAQPAGDGVVRLVVTGEVDLCTAAQLVAATRTALARHGPAGVLVDLAGVTFLDACGLNSLVAAYRVAGEHGAMLRVVNAHGGASLSLTAAGLAEVLCGDGFNGSSR